ncbi:iron ABC transporter permease [Nocardiopsis sp. HNM0947]|uniref:Iron ABC transporter permease n=1 Tax=Nocardiopsis coralli TaxID=2772213 RepID=A0ABR9P517_9ACTN|nr:iron ABC transporter permease [Nocardiopsis coralli]
MSDTASDHANTPVPDRRTRAVLPLLGAGVVAALTCALSLGSTPLPPAEVAAVLFGTGDPDPRAAAIVWEVRLPRALTGLLAGAALGLAGLQMQTLLRNPLAEPYVLGVSSGASLGVALVVLAAGAGGGTFTAGLVGLGRPGLVLAAAFGAGAVMALILLLARWTSSVVTLLVIGVMVGSVVSSVVSILISYARAEDVQRFVLWGLGSFSATGWSDLAWFAPVLVAAMLLSAFLVKPLNALLLGEAYARTMGVRTSAVRWTVIAVGALLAGTVTAFCGPVAFLGLAVPHLARIALRTADHRVLVPGVVLMGGGVAVACGTVAVLPGTGGVLPLNAVTALVGAPIVIGVLLNGRAAKGVNP